MIQVGSSLFYDIFTTINLINCGFAVVVEGLVVAVVVEGLLVEGVMVVVETMKSGFNRSIQKKQ